MALLGFLTYAILDRRILNTKLANIIYIWETSKTFESISIGNSSEWYVSVPAKAGYTRFAVLVQKVSGSGSNSVIVNIHGDMPDKMISVHAGYTNISNLMQISSDTIKDIDVPASGSVMITFTKFKPKRGYNRVVLAHSFNNSSNGGSNYSGMFIYNTTGATDGIQVFIHNVWSSKGKVNLSLTVAYIQSYFFN